MDAKATDSNLYKALKRKVIEYMGKTHLKENSLRR